MIIARQSRDLCDSIQKQQLTNPIKDQARVHVRQRQAFVKEEHIPVLIATARVKEQDLRVHAH